MSEQNPQNKDFILSKGFNLAQDIFGIITLVLAIVQGITSLIPAKIFLVISGVVLFIEYMSSYCKNVFFDKGHRIREIGLIDNSFNEKKIPNYNSEPYYNNACISKNKIKLLANIHENSLFTSSIAGEMSLPYYFFSAVTFLFFITKLFMSGMDDYSSSLLGFIASSSLFDRAIKLHSLKKSSKDVYDKVNEICNVYEKCSVKTSMILPQIIEVLLLYENAVFESKIILSERIFSKRNDSLSKDWLDVRDKYLIYKCQKECD